MTQRYQEAFWLDNSRDICWLSGDIELFAICRRLYVGYFVLLLSNIFMFV